MKINKAAFQPLQGTAKVLPKKSNDVKTGDKVELEGNKSKVDEGIHKKWLFMNYIAADCNLKEYQAANVDNQELAGSDANTHVVAMIDVGPYGPEEAADPEATGLIDWSGGRTYYIKGDYDTGKINSPVIAEHGDKINMTDPKVLTAFIVDTMKKFPSDHVALVMNDHGGGYTGAMSDNHDGKKFTIPQIKNALLEAEKITGKKLDILGFDACLMADAQAAYELKDVAKYYLASEEVEYGPGWTYNPMLDGSFERKGNPKQISNAMGNAIGKLQEAMSKKINVSPEEFAKVIVRVNKEYNEDIPTFSATDLSKMDNIAKATDKLAEAILKTEEKPVVKKSIIKAKRYGGSLKPYKYMHDLGHAASLMEENVNDPEVKKAAKEVQKAIEDAILAKQSTYYYRKSTGLHIFAPDNGDMESYGYQDLQFAKDTKWDEAITELGKVEPAKADNKDSRKEVELWPDGTPI